MTAKLTLIINPEDQALNTVLACGWYKNFWENNQQVVIEAFNEITGLDFQQREIIANVKPGSFAKAGDAETPMILPVDYETDKNKTITIMHELGHRLLGGNALSPIGLGLQKDSTIIDDSEFQLFEHRHLYLFLYDVVEAAFGKEYAQACEKESLRTSDQNYLDAWHWAMNMHKSSRRHAIFLLAKQSLTRDRWRERDATPVVRRDPDAWFESLAQK